MGTKSVKKAFCVDHWILENNGYEYQNKRSEIIQEYLYDGKGVDLSEFDIRNYDIDLLCNIACCGCFQNWITGKGMMSLATMGSLKSLKRN